MEDVERRYRTPRGEFIPSNFDRVSSRPRFLPGGPGKFP